MTLSEVQASLTTLRGAREKILSGQQAVSVTLPDGSRAEFQVARMADINSEIARLEVQERLLSGASSQQLAGNRPILPIL